ncbi:MAG: hypothetical protein E7607_07665 [Ruminococcaceae bacterium]|nr:hypothetical protein [Oscillospiraceae bacterium]
MAAIYNNESYDRCLSVLRERYKGRGISENVKSEAALQIGKETSTRAIAPGAYVLFDSKSKIADVYRSGEYRGSKYMTSDDFVRYFKSRRAFYSPALEKEELPKEAGTTKAPIRRSASRSGLVPSESGGKEGHLKTAISAIKVFKEKWFPVEQKEGREQTGGFRIPAAAATGVAVFALSLGLIVSGSVMSGSASGKVSKLDSKISVLENEQTELQNVLDLKYNLDDIENEARSLGMVKYQNAEKEYINFGGEEQITVYDEDEDEKVGLSTLLSSFGIDLD